MRQNFEIITPLFEGQVNERCQFKLSIDGNDYRGIFHDEEVQWFQPPPDNEFEKRNLDLVESHLHEFITNHLKK